MPDWAIVLIGFLGIIIGALITFFTHWWERKERYQVLTFPKRLEAHQQVLSFCLEIRALLILLQQVEKKIVEKEKVDKLYNLCEKAGEWWKNNLLYLDERSSSTVSKAILLAWDVAIQVEKKWAIDEASTKVIQAAIAELDNAEECIVKGIGVKYLPELKKLETLKRQ